MTAALNPHPPQEYARANHFFVVVLWVAFAASLALAPWHGTWTAALLVGLPAALIPTLLILSAGEAAITRIGVGAALMVFCGLHIHQAGGMIEVHFGIFALLALLVIYEAIELGFRARHGALKHSPQSAAVGGHQ